MIVFLLCLFAGSMSAMDSNNPDEIDEIRTGNNCYYLIKYSNGRRVSIFKQSPDIYIYCDDNHESALDGQKGAGIYDEFASLYKEWKAGKKYDARLNKIEKNNEANNDN